MTDIFIKILEIQKIPTIIFLILLILRPFTLKYQTTSWHYNIYRISILSFILPINHIAEQLNNFLNLNRFFINNISKIYDYRFNNLDSTTASITILNTDITNPNILNPNILNPNISNTINNINLLDILAYTWAIIFIILTLWFTFCNIKFLKNIKTLEKENNPKILEILNNALYDLELKTNINILKSDDISSPVLVGFFKPVIILPISYILNFNNLDFNNSNTSNNSNQEIKYILKHELIHLKRKDLYIKNIMFVIQLIFWSNPIIYLFRIELDKFMEYSCDELVVNDLTSADKKVYGLAILNAVNTNMPNYTAFGSSKNKLKRRIENMIKFNNNNKSSKIITLGVAICCLSIPVLASVGNNSEDFEYTEFTKVLITDNSNDNFNDNFNDNSIENNNTDMPILVAPNTNDNNTEDIATINYSDFTLNEYGEYIIQSFYNNEVDNFYNTGSVLNQNYYDPNKYTNTTMFLSNNSENTDMFYSDFDTETFQIYNIGKTFSLPNEDLNITSLSSEEQDYLIQNAKVLLNKLGISIANKEISFCKLSHYSINDNKNYYNSLGMLFANEKGTQELVEFSYPDNKILSYEYFSDIESFNKKYPTNLDLNNNNSNTTTPRIVSPE